MLAQVIPHKEVPMSEQGLLFVPRKPDWVAAIWQRCDPEVYRKCIAILAEMGRGSLAPDTTGQVKPASPKPRGTGKGVADEC